MLVRYALQRGLKVTAKGVETQQQYEFLASLGEEEITVQGYYFSRAVENASVVAELELEKMESTCNL